MRYKAVKEFADREGYDSLFEALQKLFPANNLYGMSVACFEEGSCFIWKAKGRYGDVVIGWSEQTGLTPTHQIE